MSAGRQNRQCNGDGALTQAGDVLHGQNSMISHMIFSFSRFIFNTVAHPVRITLGIVEAVALFVQPCYIEPEILYHYSIAVVLALAGFLRTAA